jgi:hypothetical protein
VAAEIAGLPPVDTAPHLLRAIVSPTRDGAATGITPAWEATDS